MARGERRSLVSLHLEDLGSTRPSCLLEECRSAAGALERLTGKRSHTPWFSLPFSLREADLERMRDLSAELVANSDVLLVLGSEDLERGARALVEASTPPRGPDEKPLEFVGTRWAGPERLPRLLEGLGRRRVGLLLLGDDRPDPGMVVALRMLWGHVAGRHGQAESRRRILVATTSRSGPLQEMAEDEGLRLVAPPVAVPRRYSSFTPAALLPLALAGIDPGRIVEGARSQGRSMEGQDPAESPTLQYALVRILLAEEGRATELLATTDPALEALLREGERLLTFPQAALRRAPLPLALSVPEALYVRQPWLDAAGKTVSATLFEAPPVAEAARAAGGGPPLGWEGLEGLTPAGAVERSSRSAAASLVRAGIPCLQIRVPRLDPFHLGALLFFLHCARGLTAGLHAPEADKRRESGFEKCFAEGDEPPPPEDAVEAPEGADKGPKGARPAAKAV